MKISPYLLAILLIMIVVLGVSLMFQSLKTTELAAEVQFLQADKQPKQVFGTHNNVEHKQKMKR